MSHDPLPFDVAVHIGYRKTASTWLQLQVLLSHPEVLSFPQYPLGLGLRPDVPLVGPVVTERDAGFDPVAVRRDFVARIRRRGVALEGRTVVVSAERFSGHPASGGDDAMRIARRLHAVLPEARVFWFLRDRAGSIRSEYKQLVREGWTGTVGRTLEPPMRWRRPGFDLAHWEYEHLLTAYQDLFGADRVQVFDYARVGDEPDDVLGDLAAFLAVDPWPVDVVRRGARAYPSPSDRATRWRRVLNHAARSELNPFPPVALPAPWLSLAVRGIERIPGGRPLFDDGFDERIRERFVASDRRLAELGVELRR